MFNQILTSTGLSKEGSDIYLSLLNNGPQSASGLAKNTPVGRTYVYRICQELEKMNLVSIQKRGSSTIFSALSPSILLNSVENQKNQLESASTALQFILPQLQLKYQLIDQRPSISYYEGVEGIKKIYTIINRDKKTLYLFRSAYDEKTAQYQSILENQLQEQAKLGIKTKTITPLVDSTKQTYLKLDQERLVERHISKNPKFLLPSEIMVFGDKTTIISRKTSTICTLIDNHDIAQTFKQLFDILWQTTQAEHDQITASWQK